MKLDHIGIIVQDIAVSKKYYEEHYGFKDLTGEVDEPAQKVKVMFLDIGYGRMPSIELIQPVDESSSVSAFLKKTGGGLHHLCYEVEDMDKAIEHFKGLKSFMVGHIYPGAGHKGQKAVWFYTQKKELIELIEGKKK